MTHTARILLFCLIACLSACTSVAQQDRPNILLILIDDMGWKDVGYAGSTYYQTPHIDRLAKQGVVFTQAYSAAPVCTPARGALFSGKYPARTQMTAVFAGPCPADERLFEVSKYNGSKDQMLEARHRKVLPKKEVTFARALAEGGYATGFFGKWHIGEVEGYHPIDRGFQVASGYRKAAAPTSRSGHWMRTFAEHGANMEGVDPDAYLADVLTQQCIDFIREKKDGPWLAVLSHYLVHRPIDPRPDKLAKYKDKPKTDQHNPGFAGMVESVDDSVGRVLKALDELGLDDNTLVIFTSDNGGLTPRSTSNYPLLGGKSFPFEAGMAVPLVIRWPAKIEPGQSGWPVIAMDFYPTMLSAAGLAPRPKQHADGVDLLPLLAHKKQLPERPLIFHHPHYTHAAGPFSSIIDDGWKLIRFYNDAEGAYLLYHLSEDREERNNLAKQRPDQVKRLSAKLDAMLKSMNAEMTRPNPDYQDAKGFGKFSLRYSLELAEREREQFQRAHGD